MVFEALPTSAAWRHEGLRSGCEVTFVEPTADGWVLRGCTTAVEGAEPWVVGYEIVLDVAGTTRGASVRSRSRTGHQALDLTADGSGSWWVRGRLAPHLDGCLDVDLESSALTNALPVRRLALAPGDQATAPAAFVAAPDLGVTRLEQHYRRVDDDARRQRFAYEAPAFGFSSELEYDQAGLVLRYPGIAVRTG